MLTLEQAEQDYFLVVSHLESSLVLDVGKATSTADGKQQVLLWEHNWQDSQLWFWDGPKRDILRNKKYPRLVSLN